MKVNNLKLQTCLLGVISMAFFSCQSNSSGTSNTNASDSLAKASPQQSKVQAGSDSVNFVLPSPLQIASILFKSAGFKYLPAICTPIKDGAQFNSHYQMAINMGLYSSDLSYCLINKQTDDATKYLNVVKVLADKLGFGSIFKANSLVQRFQNNMNNTDSLASLVGEMQMETDMYLEENNQKYINTIAYTGALVESMHIGGAVYEKEKNPGESSCLTQQINIMEGLIKLLTKYQSSDAGIPTLITQLKELTGLYHSFDEVKNTSDQTPLILTPDHISQLDKAVKTLRDKFIAS